MDGFINLNKPAGWTSHDCIAKVRRVLRQKKVGHAGTLDPSATGVLPIAVGRATRLLQFLQGTKAYRATIRFGIRTATDDLDGEVIEQQDASHLAQAEVVALLPTFQGVIQQVPPSYSAIQVDGKRLYDLAREGKVVDVPVRTVEIYDLHPLAWRAGSHPELDVAIACGSGTYIRAIARDLGNQVGTGAALATLERTESSGFHLADSVTLEQLEHQLQQNQFSPTAPAVALHHLPTIQIDRAIARRWRMGQKVLMDAWKSDSASSSILDNSGVSESSHSIVCVFEEGDRFIGVGEFIPVPTDMPVEQSNDPSIDERQDHNTQSEEAQIQQAVHEGQMLLRPRMVFVPV
ncbi:MAG: tRNA pseudouridine(55) synthase TruB [Cyanobacteria bacterium P01_A01_bin.37]